MHHTAGREGQQLHEKGGHREREREMEGGRERERTREDTGACGHQEPQMYQAVSPTCTHARTHTRRGTNSHTHADRQTTCHRASDRASASPPPPPAKTVYTQLPNLAPLTHQDRRPGLPHAHIHTQAHPTLIRSQTCWTCARPWWGCSLGHGSHVPPPPMRLKHHLL